MKKPVWRIFVVIIIVSIIAGVISCSDGGNSPVGPTISDGTGKDIETGCSVLSNTVLGYTNYERCLQGLAPLSASSQLDAAAQCHTDDMVNRGYISHVALVPAPCGGVNTEQRITTAGYFWNTYGENIANGYSSPQAVVAAWMGSQSHRANILNPGFVDMGIGRSRNIWTQVFGSR
jgi:uncharacterized protein YkwD